MSQQISKTSWESFADFLADAPPGSSYDGNDITEFKRSLNAHYVARVTLKLYCAECEAVMNFDTVSDVNAWNNYEGFVVYHCRHCHQSIRIFALVGQRTDTENTIIKVGQVPPFGPHIPAKLQRLIQDDRETFLKGIRAESLNLGVGAFAYYRRVVERQKDKLCDAIIKVAERLGYAEDVINDLKAAKTNWQFKQGIESIKDAIPEAFQINGHNPLTLLHNALSEGVHNLSDEECLARAQDARTVLTAMAERLSALSAEQQGLHDAVKRLAKKKTST